MRSHIPHIPSYSPGDCLRHHNATAWSSLMWQPDVKRQTSATAWDSVKLHISTVWSAQHPNAAQNIQHLVVSKLIFSSLSWVLEIWFCEVATSSLFSSSFSFPTAFPNPHYFHVHIFWTSSIFHIRIKKNYSSKNVNFFWLYKHKIQIRFLKCWGFVVVG